MFTWDYRVFNVGNAYNGGDPWYVVEEVVFVDDKTEAPCRWPGSRLGSDSIEGLREQLKRMLDALDQPVIELQEDR